MGQKIFQKTINRSLDYKTITQGSSLVALFAICMTFMNLISHHIGIAMINAGLAVWVLLNFLLYRKYRKDWLFTIVLMAGIYALMMYYLITGGVDGFSILWLLVIPPAVQYCFSSYYGEHFTFFTGVAIAIYMWSPLFELGYPYPVTYRNRFPIVYFFIAFMCNVVQHRVDVYRSRQEVLIENLEYAGRTKNDFLANMSHEIRTPMNAIVGMCELILRDDINENVRENCFNIQNSSRSLLNIINDILDFSKIEAGKIDLIEDTFNIASTINDVINMAMTRKGDKDIEIIVRVDPTIPKGLVGDELRIRQVIINLLTNAVKFTQSGCVVMKVTQSRHVYGINLNVSIKDTGIGISQENIEKLFTSFQQVDTKKNRSVEGTGLGLAISKRLISQMGGFINVSSNYGEGSEFRFVIPLRVSNQDAFIHINDADNVNVAVFLDWKKYNHKATEQAYAKLVHELGNGFGIRFTIFSSFEELKREIGTGEYTHCFTAKEEYQKHMQWFDEISAECQLAVVQDRFSALELPEHIKKVSKPFYALSFAAVMNNDRFVMDVHGQRSFAARFIAPEAKILIVDDNAINLKVAAGLMKPYNMKIITASSGPEAIEAIQSKDFDIVFMDHMMPEMDGVEATQIIRNMKERYYEEVPIIALTANAVNGAREMFLGNGFNDFLPKPIETAVLDRVLRAWLPQQYVITTSTLAKKEKARPIIIENKNVADKEETGNNKKIVDYEKGLSFAGGDEDTYFDILDVYVTSSAKYKEELEVFYKEKDWEKYTIKIHALKSSSLSVGAEDLSVLAKEMEMAGKAGQYETICKHHENAMKQYEDVVIDIEKHLQEKGYSLKKQSEENNQELQDITKDTFEEKVNRLMEACENFDGEEAVTVAEELCACRLNDIALAEYFAKVKEYADDYEYEQALEAVQDAVKTIKEEG